MINIDILDVMPLIKNNVITLAGIDGNSDSNYLLFSYHIDPYSSFGGLLWFKQSGQDSLYSIGITEITNIQRVSTMNIRIIIDTSLYPS